MWSHVFLEHSVGLHISQANKCIIGMTTHYMIHSNVS